MKALKYIELASFKTLKGTDFPVRISYETFGLPIGDAPVVLVNHALTGNSTLLGENGWWNDIVGDNKLIDTLHYTVISFNIPGNGYDGLLIEDYQDLILADVAHMVHQGLQMLNIASLHAAIGGSIGGGLAWELAAAYPSFIKNLIPIATDWKSSDWVIANAFLQDQILDNSSSPIHDARLHAMLCYRTPGSFKSRFDRSINEELKIYNVESWLLHHGEKLQQRFQVGAYKLMNHLLRTIDISQNGDFESVVAKIESNIYLVSIDTDLFFTDEENRETYLRLSKFKKNIFYKCIRSIHGHDAFLIEFEQLNQLLKEVFTINKS
ncbi:MAG: alpha/beta fold hydrolase [Flavobacteriaceae bacterium]|nr:alpha/beta fold hydrolase [Flavobacteriaceae bacterium]MDG2314130.1 alpha/beta fold hydrolase [Flavobacteriaceae bacterium]